MADQKEHWPSREQFLRTEMLLGAEGMKKLREARVAVFGVGGVGGYVTEALARSGVGAFELIDNDVVSLSNLNRQIIATRDTVGQRKTEIMRERILRINPWARVTVRNCFFLPETAEKFDFSQYSYVVDAVDTVTAKLELVLRSQAAGVPIISSMGTGNKLNPALLQVADIYQTKVCPLAKVMRKELKARGVKQLKVVYSEEQPIRPEKEGRDHYLKTTGEANLESREKRVEDNGNITGLGQEKEWKEMEPDAAMEYVTGPDGEKVRRRDTPGSTSFVPPVAGMIIASEVVRDLTGR